MAVRTLKSSAVGWPVFSYREVVRDTSKKLNLFHLSSHQRARKAINFGLNLSFREGNIYVIGENQTGRMDSTHHFLKNYFSSSLRSHDWVYLNNFFNPTSPRPYQFSAGTARIFREDMSNLINTILKTLPKLFKSKEYEKEAISLSDELEIYYEKDLQKLRTLAKRYHLDVSFDEEGSVELIFIGEGASDPKEHYQRLSEEEKQHVIEGIDKLRPHTWRLSSKIQEAQELVSKKLKELKSSLADEVFSGLFDKLEHDFFHVPGLLRWLVAMRKDILENLEFFSTNLDKLEDKLSQGLTDPKERYAVNVLVDRYDEEGRPVVVKSNPTYENIFGAIKYKSASQGGYETNFTMINSGALHQANGGILVLRAEELFQQEDVWKQLKGALRDEVIYIEEPYKIGNIHMLEAPNPEPIPLSVKVIIVGSAYYFHNFFYNDSNFRTYFQIKAEIDTDMLASSKNLGRYAYLIKEYCQKKLKLSCSKSALRIILGIASMYSGSRKKLTSKFESIEIILSEAAILTRRMESKEISDENIYGAYTRFLSRNGRLEEKYLEKFKEKIITIQTQGKKVGQINGLTVTTEDNFQFGLPARITTTTYCDKAGIINIERQVKMAGPIQQKGVFILEGFLKSCFAQEYPLSLGCSLTFEQLYSEVDGDSASMAELCVILSSLSDVPLRQDLAITGSVDQKGNIQAIGGVSEKIKGFYKVCLQNGLKGLPGVIIPRANEKNIFLDKEICKAIEKGLFSVYSVSTVKEALELLTEEKLGTAYQKNSILGKCAEKLKKWYKINAD